jgi:Resolvase, N terminal domain
VEIASTRGDRLKLREALDKLQAGDTLAIYKPDRLARSMKELLVLLEWSQFWSHIHLRPAPFTGGHTGGAGKSRKTTGLLTPCLRTMRCSVRRDSRMPIPE